MKGPWREGRLAQNIGVCGLWLCLGALGWLLVDWLQSKRSVFEHIDKLLAACAGAAAFAALRYAARQAHHAWEQAERGAEAVDVARKTMLVSNRPRLLLEKVVAWHTGAKFQIALHIENVGDTKALEVYGTGTLRVFPPEDRPDTNKSSNYDLVPREEGVSESRTVADIEAGGNAVLFVLPSIEPVPPAEPGCLVSVQIVVRFRQELDRSAPPLTLDISAERHLTDAPRVRLRRYPAHKPRRPPG